MNYKYIFVTITLMIGFISFGMSQSGAACAAETTTAQNQFTLVNKTDEDLTFVIRSTGGAQSRDRSENPLKTVTIGSPRLHEMIARVIQKDGDFNVLNIKPCEAIYVNGQKVAIPFDILDEKECTINVTKVLFYWPGYQFSVPFCDDLDKQAGMEKLEEEFELLQITPELIVEGEIILAIETTKTYKILGLPDGASQQAVRSAYKRLARKWHPDKLKKEESDKEKFVTEVFKKIANAYEALTGPAKSKR